MSDAGPGSERGSSATAEPESHRGTGTAVADQAPGATPRTEPGTAAPQVRRLPRVQRRAQIIAAATRAFARTGFTATSLDDIAAEAGISRVILYRHFASKADLYRAILDHTCRRLAETVGVDDFTGAAVPALLRAASADPDGFRLLFRHAAREPEFRDVTDGLTSAARDIARRHLATVIRDEAWAAWAAQLAPVVAIEGVIGWLDAGQPDPDTAGDTIGRAIAGVIQAARNGHT